MMSDTRNERAEAVVFVRVLEEDYLNLTRNQRGPWLRSPLKCQTSSLWKKS